MIYTSDNKKVTWVRIGKCASTTIQDHLEQHIDDLKLSTSCTSLDYQSKYFTFCCVRNPWARLYSCYVNKIIVPGSVDDVKGSNFLKQMYVDQVSFDKFIKKITESSDILLRTDRHWMPYYHILNIFGKHVDVICRVENFQHDFEVVCNSIDIPGTQFECKNKTKKPNYVSQYNDESRMIVEKVYKKDIKKFNYKFGE